LEKKNPFQEGADGVSKKQLEIKIKHSQPLLTRDDCDDEVK